MELSASAALTGMKVGLGAFFFLFLAQVLVWRCLRPRQEIRWLFTLYFFLPLTILPFSLEGAVFALALSLAFLITFPAVQAESPSLWLINALWRAGGKMERAELEKALGGEANLLEARSQDLSVEGFTESSGRLTPFGRMVARIYRFYRHILGMGSTG